MRKTLETLMMVLQVFLLLAVALIWWNRLNEETGGGLVNWLSDRFWSIRFWITDRIDGPRGQQFRAWADRYWGNPSELDGD